MIYSRDYHLEMEDFVAGGKMSLYGIMKNLENTGYKHSESVGDGVFYGHELNQAWVSIDWLLQIDEYPTCGQKIVMDTWSQPCTSAAVAARDFILSADGKVVVRATTRCALVDLKEGRPMRMSKEILEKYQPEDKKSIDIKRLERLEVPQEFDFEKEILLRRNDFDYNGHIHNLNYLPLALEALNDEDFSKPINTLRISYKSAIKAGTKSLTCKCKKIQDRQFIFMYTEGELRCIVVLN